MQTSGMVEISGGSLYFETVGEGQPIIFIHGGGTSSRIWDAQVPVFARQHQVTRYDQRGSGRSPAASAPYSPVFDLLGVMDCLEVPQAVLIGSSAGGGIALDFALEYPDRVKALVLAAPGLSGHTESGERRARMERVHEATRRGDSLAAITALMADPHFAPLQSNPQARDLLRSILLENQSLFRPRSAQRLGIRPPAAERLGDLRTPTLVMIGDHDDADNTAIAERIAQQGRDVEKVRIANAAHLIHLDRPETFDRIVLEFLERRKYG